MISIALIILSCTFMVSGKMPLSGGNLLRGIKVRLIGAFILAVSLGTLFSSPNISMILSVTVIVCIAAVYFFISGEVPTEEEAKHMLFTSSKEEKGAYKSAIVGLVIAIMVMAIFGGGAWALIRFIKGM